MDEAEYCDRMGFIYHGKLIAIGSPEELKTSIMQEKILEVNCDRPHEAMDEIAGIDAVKESALFGKSLHVVVYDENTAVRQIPQVLTESGYKVSKYMSICTHTYPTSWVTPPPE